MKENRSTDPRFNAEFRNEGSRIPLAIFALESLFNLTDVEKNFPTNGMSF
jgi:hypothetical protein